MGDEKPSHFGATTSEVVATHGHLTDLDAVELDAAGVSTGLAVGEVRWLSLAQQVPGAIPE